MAQVVADGLDLAVNQIVSQWELMKGLIPEFALRLGVDHPVTDTGQRWGYNHGLDQLWAFLREGLGDAASDVVAGQHWVM